MSQYMQIIKKTSEFNTIGDMLDYYYPSSAYFEKTDAPMLTTTTGFANVFFGEAVWNTYNAEANYLGVIPKTVWKKTGWRVETDIGGTAADGGSAENAAIADSVKPTRQEVSNTLKENQHVFEVSERLRLLSDTDDDTLGDLELERMKKASKHKKAMSQQLVVDVSAGAAAATANYAGKDGFETLDRVISSDSEEDAFGGTYTGWFDIFGLDRDAGTTFDSYVDHNSGTDRAISDSIIRTTWQNVGENGGNTNVIMTGWDTLSNVMALYSDQVRYNKISDKEVSFGVNGIQTKKGVEVGIIVSSVYGIPIIPSENTPKDTGSRMFFLDISDPEGFGEPRLSLSLAAPTLYFESGMSSGNPFTVGTIGTKGMFYTAGEIKAPGINFQAKVRDLL